MPASLDETDFARPGARSDPPALHFNSSRNAQAARSRRWMWLALVVGLVVALLRTGFNGAVVVATAIVLALLAVVDWFVIRPRTRAGQVVFTVGHDTVESPRFTTKVKRYAWDDILDASIEVTRAGRVLALQLRPSPRRPDRRSFFNGINPSRPAFALAPLDAPDQERLFDAISQRLRERGGPADGAAAPGPVNVLTEERLFAERLRALAPRTWVTWGLVALNAAVWAGTVALGGSMMRADTLQLYRLGGNSAWGVQHGEYWRLLAATFLHGNFLHMAINMAGLLATGPTVERIYGHRLFLLIYLGAALAGSVTSLHFSAQTVVSVGASGAVFGVAGAMLVAVFHHRKSLPRLFGKQTLSGLGFFVAYSLFQGAVTPGIDNGAHVGGLVAGAALALILPERFDLEHFRRTVRLRAPLAALLMAVAVAVVAATAPRAPYDLGEVYAAGQALQRGIDGFSQAWKALQDEANAVKAGTISEIESDERSRTVHAPRLRLVLRDLSQIKLPPNDPRAPLAADYTRFVTLLLESLAMESRVVEGKPQPVDPARAEAINAELAQVDARIGADIRQLKRTGKR
jgi:rhomboid protease GluP